MTLLSKYRSHYKFARPAKPRHYRGTLRKGTLENRVLIEHGTAVGQRTTKASRRLNRLPEWTDPKSYLTKDGRHRLKGKDYTRLRMQAAERAEGWCEGGCGRVAVIFVEAPDPIAGEMAHNEHGSRKSDELHRVKWKNCLCHRWEHDTGLKECAPLKQELKAEVL